MRGDVELCFINETSEQRAELAAWRLVYCKET